MCSLITKTLTVSKCSLIELFYKNQKYYEGLSKFRRSKQEVMQDFLFGKLFVTEARLKTKN